MAALRRIVSDEVLDALFRKPRGRDGWLARPVGDTMLRALWELVKLGPACGDNGPARLLFVRSDGAKARLAAAIGPAGREAVMCAPVTVVIAYPQDGDAAAAARSSGLCAAYLIVAARALGLDCVPVDGFDPRSLEESFFPEDRLRAGFVCRLGYRDEAQPAALEPRPGFDEACAIP